MARKSSEDDEKFSSEFSKSLTINHKTAPCQEEIHDDEDDDDLEEPFVIKETTPDSDDSSSDDPEECSEKDKSTEEPPPPLPLVDPETTAHPITSEATLQMTNLQSSISMLMPISLQSKPSNCYDNFFGKDDKNKAADNGSEIIQKIKLAEKIYNNNTEDEDTSEKQQERVKPPKSFAAAL